MYFGLAGEKNFTSKWCGIIYLFLKEDALVLSRPPPPTPHPPPPRLQPVIIRVEKSTTVELNKFSFILGEKFKAEVPL